MHYTTEGLCTSAQAYQTGSSLTLRLFCLVQISLNVFSDDVGGPWT